MINPIKNIQSLILFTKNQKGAEISFHSNGPNKLHLYLKHNIKFKYLEINMTVNPHSHGPFHQFPYIPISEREIYDTIKISASTLLHLRLTSISSLILHNILRTINGCENLEEFQILNPKETKTFIEVSGADILQYLRFPKLRLLNIPNLIIQGITGNIFANHIINYLPLLDNLSLWNTPQFFIHLYSQLALGRKVFLSLKDECYDDNPSNPYINKSLELREIYYLKLRGSLLQHYILPSYIWICLGSQNADELSEILDSLIQNKNLQKLTLNNTRNSTEFLQILDSLQSQPALREIKIKENEEISGDYIDIPQSVQILKIYKCTKISGGIFQGIRTFPA